DLVHHVEVVLQPPVLSDDAARVDDRLRQPGRLAVPGADLPGLGEHGDPALVGPPGLDVDAVDLLARLEDRLRPLGRALAVRGGRVEGDGDDDHARVLWLVVETEDPGARERRGVRIEVVAHSALLLKCRTWLQDMGAPPGRAHRSSDWDS